MTAIKFLCGVILIFAFFNEVYGEKSFKIQLTSLGKCKLPENVMDKNPPLTYSFSLRKINRESTLVTSNFSVTTKAGPFFFSYRGYEVKQNAVRDLISNIPNQHCKSILSVQSMRVMQLKFDDDCFIIPGIYEKQGQDINVLFNDLFNKFLIMEGRYSFEMDLATNKGVAACVVLSVQASKVKDKNHLKDKKND